MKTVVGWAIAAVAGLVLLSACGGGGGEGTPKPAQETPTPEVTEEPPDRSDVSFVANLLAKEEAGEWTRGEGLVATLKLFAGELDAKQVLRHPDLIRNEGTGIFKMASEYLDDGSDAEAQAEITRLLNFLVFSNDQLEAMAGLSPSTAGLPGQLALGSARGPEEDCLQFFYPSDFEPPEGVGQCLEVKSTTIDGKLYRVFFPSPPVAGWTEDHAALALEAMEETVPKFNKLWTVPMPGVNLVLSVSATPGGAAATPNAGEPCGVVLYTDQQVLTIGDRKQFIAHELAHCFQAENFPAQDDVKSEVTAWREEGLAEYLSNVAYSKNNLEWASRFKLAGEELTTTLFDRSYENFIWFQHLANSIGDDGVFAVVEELPTSGGRGDQEAALANARGDIGDIYHDFAKKMTDEEIADTGGGTIPYKMNDTNRPTVTITAPATPLVQREFKPFGVARRRLLVQEGKLACLDFNGQGLVVDGARPTNDGTEWLDLPPTLPEDSGDDGDRILVVTTTEPDGEFTLDAYVVKDLDADAGEELACACLVGTWVVDNDDVRQIHEANLGEAADTVSVNGKVMATYEDGGVDPDTLEATGLVTFEFDGWELRSTKETPPLPIVEGWVYWEAFQDLDVEAVTRSEGTARGGYVANGSQLELGVGDFETTVTITAALGREGGTTSALPDLARVYVIPGVVTYQCSDDRLAIPWEQGETVEWTRVQ